MFRGGPASNDSDYEPGVHAYMTESKVRNRILKIVKDIMEIPDDLKHFVDSKDTKAIVKWYDENVEPTTYKVVDM